MNAQPDEDDDFEDAQEDSAMLRSSSSSSGGPSTASAPRHVVYPDEDEISIAPEASSSSSAPSPFTSSLSRTSSLPSTRNNGARTTNVSFLARITGRQRPGTEARRMIQSTMDGVFSNLSAKPRVERPLEEELPPVSFFFGIIEGYYAVILEPCVLILNLSPRNCFNSPINRLHWMYPLHIMSQH